MENVTWINDLKVRGSWGKLGSQNNVSPTNAYTLFNSTFGNSYYDVSGSGSIRQGFYQTNIGNENTGWEENIITNIGFDASILNRKLDVSVEWYKKRIDGLLFPQPLPATVGGASAPVINIGDIENKGMDFSATYHGSAGSDLTYNIGANITTYKNTVVDIPGPGYFDVSVARNEEGYPVGSFFGYDVIGFFQSDEDVDKSPTQQAAAPGRFKYRDVSGNNEVNTEDRTHIGNPNQDFTYGLNLNGTYKRFDLSVIFYGSQAMMCLTRFASSWANGAISLRRSAMNSFSIHGRRRTRMQRRPCRKMRATSATAVPTLFMWKTDRSLNAAPPCWVIHSTGAYSATFRLKGSGCISR